jgi:hypothetical protein
MWDDHRLAIIPKGGKWVVHVLWNSSTVELEEEYHNLPLQPLCGVSRYFFFCRFALAILCKSAFLSQRVSRNLVTLARSGSPRVGYMAADEYRVFFNTTGRSQSRSKSPRKRQHSAQDNPDGLDGTQSTSGSEADGDVEDEPDRGRTLKRKWSDVAEAMDYPDAIAKQPRSSRSSRPLKTPPQSVSPIATSDAGPAATGRRIQ